jgi:hypothetical protein
VWGCRLISSLEASVVNDESMRTDAERRVPGS